MGVKCGHFLGRMGEEWFKRVERRRCARTLAEAVPPAVVFAESIDVLRTALLEPREKVEKRGETAEGHAVETLDLCRGTMEQLAEEMARYREEMGRRAELRQMWAAATYVVVETRRGMVPERVRDAVDMLNGAIKVLGSVIKN